MKLFLFGLLIFSHAFCIPREVEMTATVPLIDELESLSVSINFSFIADIHFTHENLDRDKALDQEKIKISNVTMNIVGKSVENVASIKISRFTKQTTIINNKPIKEFNKFSSTTIGKFQVKNGGFTYNLGLFNSEINHEQNSRIKYEDGVEFIVSFKNGKKITYQVPNLPERLFERERLPEFLYLFYKNKKSEEIYEDSKEMFFRKDGRIWDIHKSFFLEAIAPLLNERGELEPFLLHWKEQINHHHFRSPFSHVFDNEIFLNELAKHFEKGEILDTLEFIRDVQYDLKRFIPKSGFEYRMFQVISSKLDDDKVFELAFELLDTTLFNITRLDEVNYLDKKDGKVDKENYNSLLMMYTRLLEESQKSEEMFKKFLKNMIRHSYFLIEYNKLNNLGHNFLPMLKEIDNVYNIFKNKSELIRMKYKRLVYSFIENGVITDELSVKSKTRVLYAKCMKFFE
ncbi:MAG: hypothetical protein H6622_10810 [Halobacteriovoraceae bacterium]|nr:hypothetical protein [Halobacteriovoraceae bacterium]